MYDEKDGGRVYGIKFASGEKNSGYIGDSDKRKIAASKVGKKALLRIFNPNASQEEIDRLMNQLNLNKSNKTAPVSVEFNGIKFYTEQKHHQYNETYSLIITPINVSFYNGKIDPVPAVTSPDKIKDFIKSKDEYDQSISDLAKDINAYASNHADFKNADDLIARAQKLEEKIKQSLAAIDGLQVADENVKLKLKECLEYEVTRVDGLYIGMKKSQNDGDFLPDFKRGGDAAEAFERANAELVNLLK